MSRQSRNKGRIAAFWLLTTLLSLSTVGDTHAGVNEWTSNGPGGGVFTALAADPRNPAVLYAGTYGAIFKTTNGGERWNRLDTQNLIGGGTYISALVFDPQQADTLYATVFGGILLKSTDGGNTWTAFHFGSEVHTPVIDLLDSNVLYAGSEQGILWKSTDGGASWDTLATSGLPVGQVNALVIDPQSCNVTAGSCSTLYAGTGAGVYKSTDSGVTWSSASTGLPGAVKTLVLDPRNSATLYAFYDSFNGFYKSTDGASTGRRRVLARLLPLRSRLIPRLSLPLSTLMLVLGY
jgi:hypothetical protein